ncbi:MAG: hypothetical protein AAF384_06335 [Pseudomonadota bacterium]
MKAHLLENYLADPPLTKFGKALTQEAADTVGLSRPQTPRALSVLRHGRYGLFELERDLLNQLSARS